MPKQQCANRVARCAELVDVGTMYCAGCMKLGAGKDRRPSSTERGYGARWQKASKAYLQAHPVAVDWFKDHKGVLYEAVEVDHIIPHRGNMTLFWDRTNWQGLTKKDHSRKTALEDGGFGHARRG